MKQIFFIFGLVVILLGVQAIPVSAQEDTGVVSVTLELTEVSISISPDAVSYGIVSVGETGLVPETPADPMIVVQNTGTCWVDMEIKGADTDGVWTLSGTAAADEYVHYFGFGGIDYTPLTTSYQDLGPHTSVSPTTMLGFKLKMDTPTESSSWGAQATSITVLATMVEEGITVTLETDSPTYAESGGPATLTATVTDADDNPVTGLSSDKFLTYIEAAQQTVTFTETDPGVSGIYQGDLDISGLSIGTHTIGLFVSDDTNRAAFDQASIEITSP